jgi:hypothetical protein
LQNVLRGSLHPAATETDDMNAFRLEPIDRGASLWRNSSEKDGVWAGAQTEDEARALVASKTSLGGQSPWQDAAITSCTLDPTISYLGAGDVVRLDGSAVGE